MCSEHVFVDTEEVQSGRSIRQDGRDALRVSWRSKHDCEQRTRAKEAGDGTRRSDELVQVFVNLEDGKTVALDMVVSDKVSDTKRRIRNRRSCRLDDVYVSFEGKELKGSDEVRSCGIDDVFAVLMNQRVRGGGMHRNKKDQRTDQAKKRPTNLQASERDPARARARESNPKAVGRRRGRRARGRGQLQGERDAHPHLDPQAEGARSESEHVLLASGARLREPCWGGTRSGIVALCGHTHALGCVSTGLPSLENLKMTSERLDKVSERGGVQGRGGGGEVGSRFHLYRWRTMKTADLSHSMNQSLCWLVDVPRSTSGAGATTNA